MTITELIPQLPNEISSMIFRIAPLGFAVVDSDTGIIYETNEAYCSYLGMDRNAVKGSTWMSFTHPDDLQDDLKCVMVLYSGGTTKDCKRTKRYIRSDGVIIYVQITLLRLPPYNGHNLHVTMIENNTKVEELKQERKRKLLDIRQIQDALFPALAILSEFRDRETGEHLLRTRIYVRLILENLNGKRIFSRNAISLISNSAMLHDIGKIGIPDSILLKNGKLTEDEFRIMRGHTTQRGRAILQIQRYLSTESSLLFAKEIAECHHERWDGTGYPYGLKEGEIPFTARVMAIADVYDALRSERPYKEAFSHSKSVRIIASSAGSHFDPELVKAFLDTKDMFEQVAIMDEALLDKID